MSLRISSLALVALIAGCGSSPSLPQQVADAPASDRVDCAIGKGALAQDCALERVGPVVTVRHADGSFRRFEIDTKGQFGAADGAEEVSGKRGADGSVDVAIGDRRYRFAAGQLKP
jgi:hypothetical protein